MSELKKRKGEEDLDTKAKHSKIINKANVLIRATNSENHVVFQIIEYYQKQIKKQKLQGDSLWHNLEHILHHAHKGVIGAFDAATGKLVGYLVGPTNHPSAREGNTIEFMEVWPAYRRQGIGRRLVREAEKIISGGGFIHYERKYDGEFNTPIVRVPGIVASAADFWSSMGYEYLSRDYWYKVIGCAPRLPEGVPKSITLAANALIATVELSLEHRKFREWNVHQKRKYYVYSHPYDPQTLCIYPHPAIDHPSANRQDGHQITKEMSTPEEFTVSLLEDSRGEHQFCSALIAAGIIDDTGKRDGDFAICKYSDATTKILREKYSLMT